jgi:hypothetical protein
MDETAAYLPSSDADRGPLANLHERARSIPAIFGAEIDRSDAPVRAAESMAGAIADAAQPDSSTIDFILSDRVPDVRRGGEGEGEPGDFMLGDRVPDVRRGGEGEGEPGDFMLGDRVPDVRRGGEGEGEPGDSMLSETALSETPLPDQRPTPIVNPPAVGSPPQAIGDVTVTNHIEPEFEIQGSEGMDEDALADEIANAMPRMVRSARRETIRELEDMLQAAVDSQQGTLPTGDV